MLLVVEMPGSMRGSGSEFVNVTVTPGKTLIDVKGPAGEGSKVMTLSGPSSALLESKLTLAASELGRAPPGTTPGAAPLYIMIPACEIVAQMRTTAATVLRLPRIDMIPSINEFTRTPPRMSKLFPNRLSGLQTL